MHIGHITIREFRNIANAELDLVPGINILWGANAQGKTNLLEAVHMLVTGRSIRARRVRDCIRWGEDPDRAALVRARLVRADGGHQIQIGIQGPRRHIEIDGAPITKLGDLWGRLNAVLFTPDDLQIVKGPPALRREFLDAGISQVRHSYLTWLQKYQSALRERTALVRDFGWRGGAAEEIDAWDRALAEAAAEVHGHRRDIIRRLEAHAQRCHRIVSDDAEALRLVHRSHLDTTETLTRDECIARHLQALAEIRSDDIEKGQTSIGPHRDDLLLFLGDTEARAFASQGQQRAIVLALRLAELALMEEEAGEPPLLLLDDIISELDPERRERFFSLLRPDVQSVITSVENPSVLAGVTVGQVIAVKSGEFTLVRQCDAATRD